MHRFKLPFPLCAYFALLSTAHADDAVFRGNGYTVFPVRSADIRMVSETIWLRYPEGMRFGVEVEEVFHNQGPATTVTIGFPFRTNELELTLDNSPDPTWVPDKFDPRDDPHFQTWVDGKLIPVILKRGVKGPGMAEAYDLVFTSTLSFKAGETKRVRHRYTVGGGSDALGGLDFQYILKTGALWKGTIGHIVIHAEINAGFAWGINFIMPNPHLTRRVGNKILMTWEYQEIKPDFDIGFHSARFLARIPSDLEHGEDIEEEVMQNKSIENETHRNLLALNRHIVLALNGYPFCNPFTRAQFYDNGTYYTENPGFRLDKIPKKRRDFIQKLADREAITAGEKDLPADPLREDLGVLARYGDLSRRSKSELRLLRNEIFARHGRIFKDNELADYFAKQSLYKPNPNYSDTLLSEVEREAAAYFGTLERSAELMVALERGEWNRALSLIKEGIDVHTTNSSGATPLLIALKSDWLEGARFLVDNGANVDAASPESGDTFLMIAVRDRSLDLVRLLIEKGVDLDRRNNQGRTALMIAMDRRDASLIRLLVEQGANVSIADSSGQTALDMVHGFRNDDEIRELLLNQKKKE